ncbi:MAG TPA: hypothetical protein VGQ25_03380 [Gemmatimonadales bacterium]|jgi:hypothetical protein|nr:hypothetical protein [Gemmatimonadales bacterium]
MFRNTLLTLALAAAPTLALAQQPAQAPAKPAQTHAMSADTTKAKARRTHARHAAAPKAKGTAARRDTTARRDSVKP